MKRKFLTLALFFLCICLSLFGFTACGEEEHECDWQVLEEVTYCEDYGYVVYFCPICGDEYSEELPPVGHDYEENVTEPTCTEEGYTTYVCKRCHDSYVSDYVDATGHDYENGFCKNCKANEPLKPSEGLAYQDYFDGTCAIIGIGSCTDTDIVIPDLIDGKTVVNIEKEAFAFNKTLTSITISENVSYIGKYAFRYCENLKIVTIPHSVTLIDENAFDNCNITSVYYTGTIEQWAQINFFTSSSNPLVKTMYDQELSDDTNLYIDNKLLTEANLTKTTYISSRAFCNSSLKSVTIGNSVTSIGSAAFSDCSSLTSITIPNSVTSIGSSAFRSCSSLTSLTIPDSVTSIGDYAFSGCSSLTSITIPDRVTSIGASAFAYCRLLTQINYNAINCSDLQAGNRIFYYAGQSGDGIKVTIGKNVKKIPNCLFYPDLLSSWSPKITSVVFDQGSVCESIGQYAFYGLTSLKKVYYDGNADKWLKISISDNNTPFVSATRYYYSATQPTDTTGNYWHYDESGNVVEW